MRGAFRAVMLAAVVAVLLASCNEESEQYEYYEYSYIDTVRAADTIANGQTVEIVYYLPGGCNRFERFETSESGDTLEVSVLLLHYFYGAPCAHGPVYTTGQHPLSFSSTGQWYLRYRRGESEWVVRDVFVE